MKIAVIGAGAMGSLYAGLLADAGNEVWAMDVWAEHVAAIRADGLHLEIPDGERVVTSVHATTELSKAGRCDLYIIATKASGVASAAQAVAQCMGPDSLVLTIQNGLGAGERIARHMPSTQVMLGVAEGFGASVPKPGTAHCNAMKRIRLGEMSGGLTSRLEKVERVWRDAGFNVETFADIDQLIWEKFVCNVTFSGPCTVFDRTIGELMRDPASWKVALGCMHEAHSIGLAKGIKFDFDDPVAYVTTFGERMPDSRPSMLQDHHARRRSEIGAINGIVPVLGEALHIATPYNETLTVIIMAREAEFSSPAS